MILGIALTLMTLGTAALIAWPFLRSGGSGNTRREQELAIYKDQLAEVDRDRERGMIGDQEADAARAEIGRRIIAIDDDADADTATGKRAPVLAIVTGICVPAMALVVYLSQGSPTLQTAAPVTAEKSPGPTAADQRARISQLADELQKDPRDLENWIELGDTLSSIKRFQRAAVAYTQAMQLAPDNADYASRTGEAMVFAADGQVTPGAEAAFREAIRRDPVEPRALFYLGLADRQGGRLQDALNRWLVLEAGSQADAPWMRFLTPRIEATAKELGLEDEQLAQMREQAKSGDIALPRGPTREQMQAAQNMSPEDRQEMIRGMVDRLADRLKENPDDVAGWQRLARARNVLGEKDAARDALGKVADLRPRDIEAQLAYADAIVDAAAPAAPPASVLQPIVDRILARDDRHPRGLWLSGALALSAGDGRTAKRQWTRLLEFVDPNSPQYVELKKQIDAIPEE